MSYKFWGVRPMPMNRSLYPKNWDKIARRVKESSQWRCQECDRPCREQGESIEDFLVRLDDPLFLLDLFEPDDDGEFGYRLMLGRFILTVAHLNHNPSDNSPGNLRALCSVCHLRHDASHHARSRKSNRFKRLEKNGQLPIFKD